jgi:hypothetical protein
LELDRLYELDNFDKLDGKGCAMPAIKSNSKDSVLKEVEGTLVSQLREIEPSLLMRLRDALHSAGSSPDLLLGAFGLLDSGAQGKSDTSAEGDGKEVIIRRGEGLGTPLSRAEGLARLAPLIEDVPLEAWVESDVLGSVALTRFLGVTGQTIANWRKQHKILALRKGLRNYVYPLRQFERQAPVAGISEVWQFFDDDEAAWEWLITPHPYAADTAPIERLRAGHTQEVVDAAEGRADFQ